VNVGVKQTCVNPYSIIVIVDMDDMLLRNFVLEQIYRVYLSGYQVTIGNYLRKDKGMLPFQPDFDNPRNN
jgi:hypothetical protein